MVIYCFRDNDNITISQNDVNINHLTRSLIIFCNCGNTQHRLLASFTIFWSQKFMYNPWISRLLLWLGPQDSISKHTTLNLKTVTFFPEQAVWVSRWFDLAVGLFWCWFILKIEPTGYLKKIYNLFLDRSTNSCSVISDDSDTVSSSLSSKPTSNEDSSKPAVKVS